MISISTDRPLRIRLIDGRELDGTLASDESGNLIVQPRDESPAIIAGLNGVASIAALPAAGPPPWDWRGNVTLGAEMKSGNTETDKLNMDSRVVIEQAALNRFTVVANLRRLSPYWDPKANRPRPEAEEMLASPEPPTHA